MSFQIRRGEYISIVGPNGAGKTTLLKAFDRMMIGEISGELDICAIPWQDWKQSDLAKLAAFVPQADSRVLPFTAEQFLLMCRYPYMSPFATVRPNDRKVVREAMVGTGTTAFAKRRLDTLSSGERQKVYIAAALAQGAHIWLLDEPTTFLDYHHQADILSLVALANKEFDVTVVAVTHDLNHAVLESDRIIALREGELVFYGTPDLVMKPDVLQRIYGTSLLMVDHPKAGLADDRSPHDPRAREGAGQVAQAGPREDEIGPGWTIGTFLVLAALAVGVAPFLGMENIPLRALWGDVDDQTMVDILWNLRIPRVLMAFIAGTALATSGMAFQAMFRNPLATPFTLGVSSGAVAGRRHRASNAAGPSPCSASPACRFRPSWGPWSRSCWSMP